MSQTIDDGKFNQSEEITVNLGDFLKKTKICPVCGTKFTNGEVLLVTFPDIAGAYCLRCYAEWIVKNLPKLVDIKSDDN